MTKRTLGAVVKQARDRARMTQRDLAAATGIKASQQASPTRILSVGTSAARRSDSLRRAERRVIFASGNFI